MLYPVLVLVGFFILGIGVYFSQFPLIAFAVKTKKVVACATIFGAMYLITMLGAFVSGIWIGKAGYESIFKQAFPIEDGIPVFIFVALCLVVYDLFTTFKIIQKFKRICRVRIAAG